MYVWGNMGHDPGAPTYMPCISLIVWYSLYYFGCSSQICLLVLTCTMTWMTLDI